MEGKSIYTILLIIITALAVALAVLVVFMFTTWNHNTTTDSTAAAVVETTMAEREVPYTESSEVSLYDGDEPYFVLKDEVGHEDSIIVLSISLKIDLGEKSKKAEENTALITAYDSDIKEIVLRYFSSITYTEAKQPEAVYIAKDALITQINETLNQGVEEPEKIVYDVVFSKWFVQ